MRAFDADVFASFGWKPPLVLDLYHIFHGAECYANRTSECLLSCGGAFESFDGVHLSPTVSTNVAQAIWRLTEFLPA